MERLKIGGLKQSLELCQFDLIGLDSFLPFTHREIITISSPFVSVKINFLLLQKSLKKKACYLLVGK